MSESQRALELRKFYAPFNDSSNPSGKGINQSIVYDGALAAYAETILWRLHGVRAMVSLIDHTTEYFVAGVIRDDSTTDGIVTCNDWFGMCTIGTPGGLCENVMAMDGLVGEYPCFEVSGLDTDSNYSHQDAVNGTVAAYRYYVGTPITTSHGVNIGSLFMFDNDLRPNGLTLRERKFLFETAANVMKHLECKREAAERRRLALMSTGISNFLERTTRSVDTDEYSNQEPPLPSPSIEESEARHSSIESANITSQTSMSGDTDIEGWPKKKGASEIVLDKIKWALDHAAEVLRESLELTAGGVIFLDTAIGPNEPETSTDYFDSVQQDLDDLTAGISKVDFDDATSPEQDLTMTGIDPKSTIPSGQFRGFYDEYRPVRVPALSCSKNSYRRSRALDSKTLQNFIDMYPNGNIWYIDENGYFSSLDQESTPNSPSRVSPMEGGRSTCNVEADAARQASEAAVLSKVFYGARQIIFLPLWDAAGNRWHSGCFVWSNNSVPVFTVDSELAYISALANSVMVEISRLDSIMANNTKTDFLSSISHEFRSPLHGILASAEFLHDSELDQTQDQLVSSIRTCGSALLETINHVLDYSKINSFEKKTASGFVSNELDITANVALLCESAVDGIIAARGFTGLIDSPGKLDQDSSLDHRAASIGQRYDHPVEIILDFENRDWMFKVLPGALRRIIMNVASNAFKFTDRGFVLIQLRVKQADRQLSDRSANAGEKILALDVVDTGRGMSKQYMERKLYTPFAQEDPFIPGVGLGLSITRSIVSQLGGKINIRSELGKGTDVEVLLPLTPPEAEPTATVNATTPLSSTYISNATESEACRGIESVRILAQGKSVAIWRVPARLASCDNELAWKAVAGYCKTWFGFTVVTDQDATSLVGADLIISEWPSPTTDETPVLPRTSRILYLQDRADRLAMRRSLIDSPHSETLALPIGPFKLAHAILALLDGSTHSTDPEIKDEQPQPVRFPSDETVTPKSLRGELVSKTPIPEDVHAKAAQGQSINRPSSRPSSRPGSRDSTSYQPTPLSAPPLSVSPDSVSPNSSTPLTAPPLTLESLSLPEPNRTLRLLAVDDNALNLLLLTRYLSKRAGDVVVTARNGHEAVAAVRCADVPFDVTFMDISMPGMDGFEATRAIRLMEVERAGQGGWGRTRIVALTGLASRRDREEAERSGFDDFLTKPVSFRLIGKLLDGLSRGDGTVGLEEDEG